jgi:intron-binding protein aquarius
LFAQLVQRLQDLETFGMDDITCAPFSTTQMQALYHERASILQKMIHQHYSQALPDLVYASVAIICEGNDTMHNSTAKTFLRKHLDTVVEWEEVLLDLAHRLRLLDKSEIDPSIRKDEDRTREFVTQVLLYHHTLQPSEAQRLQRLPLFPDETLLWNPHLVPPGHTSFLSRKTTTLALPKLGTQFLTFGDYLVRVYTLMRLESAYEIRSDLVDVIRRMKPTSSRHFSSENRMIHPQSNRNTNNTPYVNVPQLSEERIEQISRQKALTEFHGWARMGLELSTSSSFRIVQVSPPRLGENIPSQVIGELCWDLSRCSEGLRKEWDDLSDFDSLFLIAVDATAAVTIDLSPTVECDEDDPLIDDKNHLPDEEDVTFPRRYGILAVRGCTVLEIRDDVGNVVNDVARDQSDVDSDVKPICKSHLRFLRVELDAAQYAADISGRGSFLGPEVYSFLNVVVRRQAKENNFKAILETIRSLMEGSGSVHKSIPSWFRPVFLGYGDPSSVSYKSKHMMTYAQKTSGLRETNFTLDYRDTFLDESHLRESFPTCQVRIDDKDFLSGETSIRSNYRVQVFSSDNRASSVTASAYSRPANCKGNSIRFTPVQVEAIRSGLSSGISLIVGPPGKAKNISFLS